MNRNALRIALACGAMLALAACGGGDDPMVTLPDAGPAVDGGGGGRDAGTTPRRDAGPMMADCTDEATFLDCANCFCMENNAGCMAYIGAITDNIYCGATCMTDCAGVCADPTSTPTAECSTCTDGIMMGNPDLMAFQTQCSGSMDCVNFATSLQMCPM